jgi:hypothetical protein
MRIAFGVLAAVLVVVAISFGSRQRYELVRVTGTIAAWRLDRWTGKTCLFIANPQAETGLGVICAKE